MAVNNNNIYTDNFHGLKDLIEYSPDNYKHLQVFHHRDGMSNCSMDQEYLMISNNVFRKVIVLNLTVEGDYINIEFLDCTMQEVRNVRISLIDDKPSILFVCWQDIRKIVLAENTTSYSDDGLLEFDF